jgi:hypothetical protein
MNFELILNSSPQFWPGGNYKIVYMIPVQIQVFFSNRLTLVTLMYCPNELTLAFLIIYTYTHCNLWRHQQFITIFYQFLHIRIEIIHGSHMYILFLPRIGLYVSFLPLAYALKMWTLKWPHTVVSLDVNISLKKEKKEKRYNKHLIKK